MTEVLTAIFSVLTAVVEWFITVIPAVVSIFWVAGTGLTFIGTTTLIGLGIAIILLVLNVVSNYLHFGR